MNKDLQKIIDYIQASESLSDEEKSTLIKSANSVENELVITSFKLERTEKVKRTTSILLEETIEELEQKRKAVEDQAKIIQAENQRKTLELEEARQLQLAMLPKEIPRLPNLDIAVYMQTATEVGGDYYDFNVDGDGTLTAVIGDATGHGMKAGTIVTVTKSLFDSLASSKDILDTFRQISNVIKGLKFRQLAMCLLLIKIKGNEFNISSAAMPPALIYRQKTQKVEEIIFEGMPLGAMKNFPYLLKTNQIESGDTILLLSDGLPELTNSNNEMYGYDRIKYEFNLTGKRSPKEIIEFIKNSAAQWLGDQEPDDDITFVVIKMR